VTGTAFSLLPIPLYDAIAGPTAGSFVARSWDNAMAVFAIVLVVQYLDTSRLNAERRRVEATLDAEVARAQLQQLRADLNPHFLFNSLNGVAALLRDDPREAERMLKILSELLHRSSSWLESEITLGEEVGFAARYLEVQKMRFRDRLAVVIDVPPHLHDVRVPPLILQPLVENAVVHGIARLLRPGTVSVTAAAVDGALRLDIRDTGPGFSVAADDRKSIGIPNTRERLRLIYGERQSLTFGRDGDGCFVTTVMLPLRKAAA
jgi:two-component system LytT family sensor kinase